MASAPSHPAASEAPILELPVLGYPLSEEAVGNWFRKRYGRPATPRQLGAVINAMAEREAAAPLQGPTADPAGWSLGPAAPPATRR